MATACPAAESGHCQPPMRASATLFLSRPTLLFHGPQEAHRPNQPSPGCGCQSPRTLVELGVPSILDREIRVVVIGKTPHTGTLGLRAQIQCTSKMCN